MTEGLRPLIRLLLPRGAGQPLVTAKRTNRRARPPTCSAREDVGDSPARVATPLAMVATVVPRIPCQVDLAPGRYVAVCGPLQPTFRAHHSAWVPPTDAAPTRLFFAGRLSWHEGRSNVLLLAGGSPTRKGLREGLFASCAGLPLSHLR